MIGGGVMRKEMISTLASQCYKNDTGQAGQGIKIAVACYWDFSLHNKKAVPLPGSLNNGAAFIIQFWSSPYAMATASSLVPGYCYAGILKAGTCSVSAASFLSTA